MLIFVNMGPNKEWFQNRIYSFPELYEAEMEYNTVEGRKEFKLGEPYFVMRGLRQHLEQQKVSVDSSLILLPPQEYCDKNNIRFAMPEPVVCYQQAGLRTTRWNNKDVYKSDFALISIKGNMQLQPLKQDSTLINQVIEHYKSAK